MKLIKPLDDEDKALEFLINKHIIEYIAWKAKLKANSILNYSIKF